MASGSAKESKGEWNPYSLSKVFTVPGESRMFKEGKNIPEHVGEDGVSVAAS